MKNILIISILSSLLFVGPAKAATINFITTDAVADMGLVFSGNEGEIDSPSRVNGADFWDKGELLDAVRGYLAPNTKITFSYNLSSNPPFYSGYANDIYGHWNNQNDWVGTGSQCTYAAGGGALCSAVLSYEFNHRYSIESDLAYMVTIANLSNVDAYFSSGDLLDLRSRAATGINSYTTYISSAFTPHSLNPSPVPLPSALPMFLTGFIGLLAFSVKMKKRKTYLPC